jgi:hypothetical protein
MPVNFEAFSRSLWMLLSMVIVRIVSVTPVAVLAPSAVLTAAATAAVPTVFSIAGIYDTSIWRISRTQLALPASHLYTEGDRREGQELILITT